MARVSAILLLTIFSVLVESSWSYPKYRLSSNVKPTFYSIKIHPNLDDEIFTGEVFMHITVEDSTNCIEFHLNRNYLKVKTIFFDSQMVQERCLCNPSQDSYCFAYTDFELIRITHDGGIAPGAHIIYIKYEGNFSKTTEGLFKGKCGNSSDYLVVTDFQVTHARKVFPCFDEPGFKAQFQLNVVVPDRTHVALSNMRAMQIFEIDNGSLYKFETTPPMSSYLLSFAITKPSHTEYVGDNSIPFRLYAYNANNDTKLLEFSSQVIDFYTNYTKFPYTLPKVDFIGFDRAESSATENWGLVTFNTTLLSPDNFIYDDSQKKAVIAHELAHFWFGNLVTNDWWDDIWLHESIATFMGLKAEDSIIGPNASKSFPTTYMDNLFWLELTHGATPVINFQEKPDNVRKNFNEITYNKGAAVLRMLELVLKEDLMTEVFVKYIAKFAFKTATTADFINVVMNVTSDSSVREFMESYLYQNGFPVIFIEENEDSYVLTQKGYGYNTPHINDYCLFGHKWTIPVAYITDSDNSSMAWFHKDQEQLIIPKNNATWIKLNYQQIGYYRVRYSDSLWAVLTGHSKDLGRYECNNLLLEAAGLFEMNLFSCQTVLDYLWQLSNVNDRSRFHILYSVYIKINDVIKQYDTEASKKLKKFFGHALFRAKRQSFARRLLDSDSSQENNSPKSDEIQKCIEWLKYKSDEYYNNGTAKHQLTQQLPSEDDDNVGPR